MFSNRERHEIETVFRNKIEAISTSSICFISAYYIEKILEIEEGAINIAAICEDGKIVLEDALGFPLCKNKNKAKLMPLIRGASGLDELKKHLEG